MIRIILLFICLMIFQQAFSQSLSGEWEGWYTYKNNPNITVAIKLQFQLNKDSTYEVYSFTEYKKYKAACKMSYQILENNSIYLEETELVSANQKTNERLFQIMTLQLNNSFTSMKGDWAYKNGNPKHSGNVLLRKKK